MATRITCVFVGGHLRSKTDGEPLAAEAALFATHDDAPHQVGADARPDLQSLRRCASRFHRAQALVGGADVGHPNIVSLMGNGSGR